MFRKLLSAVRNVKRSLSRSQSVRLTNMAEGGMSISHPAGMPSSTTAWDLTVHGPTPGAYTQTIHPSGITSREDRDGSDQSEPGNSLSPPDAILHCPDCGTEVIDAPDCPRYKQNNRWYCCMPYCGNAWRYFCINEACGWEYRDGLNPEYPYVNGTKPYWL